MFATTKMATITTKATNTTTKMAGTPVSLLVHHWRWPRIHPWCWQGTVAMDPLPSPGGHHNFWIGSLGFCLEVIRAKKRLTPLFCCFCKFHQSVVPSHLLAEHSSKRTPEVDHLSCEHHHPRLLPHHGRALQGHHQHQLGSRTNLIQNHLLRLINTDHRPCGNPCPACNSNPSTFSLKRILKETTQRESSVQPWPPWREDNCAALLQPALIWIPPPLAKLCALPQPERSHFFKLVIFLWSADQQYVEQSCWMIMSDNKTFRGQNHHEGKSPSPFPPWGAPRRGEEQGPRRRSTPWLPLQKRGKLFSLNDSFFPISWGVILSFHLAAARHVDNYSFPSHPSCRPEQGKLKKKIFHSICSSLWFLV